jgi:hypothetical protein
MYDTEGVNKVFGNADSARRPLGHVLHMNQGIAGVRRRKPKLTEERHPRRALSSDQL